MIKIKKLDSFGKMPKDGTIIILLSDGHSSLLNEGDKVWYRPDDVKKILEGQLQHIKYNKKFF